MHMWNYGMAASLCAHSTSPWLSVPALVLLLQQGSIRQRHLRSIFGASVSSSEATTEAARVQPR
jgi:hypothetical protein